MSSEYIVTETQFQHIVLEGTSYEVGKAQGDILKQDEETIATFASSDLDPQAFGFEDLRDMQALYERHCPGVNDEIQGFADSLGVSAEKVFYYGASYRYPGNCSHMVALAPITADGHVYVGRSYESSGADQRLCTTRVYGKAHHIGFSACLLGRTDGLNQHGLSVTMSGGFSAGMPWDWPKGKGFDYWILARALLDNCETVSEALELLEDMPLYFFASFIVADRLGSAALVEIAGYQRAVRRIDSGAGDQYLIATNHFTMPELSQHNTNQGTMGHSVPRYDFIKSSLASAVPNINKETVRRILTTEHAPGCCFPYYAYGMGTLWSMIFDLTEGHVEVCFGAPTHNEWQLFTLDGSVGVTKYLAKFPDKQG
jgi:predicted choloylglycine hydrolase